MARRRRKRREIAGDAAGEMAAAAEHAVWLVLQRSAQLLRRGLGRLLDAV